MSNETLFQLGFSVLLTLLGVHAIFHERELIRFEHKVWRYTKAFFKALYITIKEKIQHS